MSENEETVARESESELINESKAIGGHARAKALSAEQRSVIAQKAATARWANQSPRVTHQGELKIGANTVLPCYVLEDGTRVIIRSEFLKTIGRTGGAKGGRKYDNEFQTPVFLTAENLKPFISSELEDNSKPVIFSFNGIRMIGYKAEFLPQVCEVFLDAKEAGKLRSNQRHIAEACRVLYRAFATVGIIALIDEATGYQQVRNREALQAILEKYLRKELAAWVKRFPDEFYQEMFRLRNWRWNAMSAKRYRVAGKYTNDIVYERLAPGILKDLEEKNPKDERGHRKAKHHQWLTDEVGHPALAQHLYAVTTLMKVSPSWKHFRQMLDQAFPKRGNNLLLPFTNVPVTT